MGSEHALRAQESSSLFRAAYKGRLDELRFLLSTGADVNSRDHGACDMKRHRGPGSRRFFLADGSTALVAAVFAEQLDAAALLLSAGAAVDAATEDGDTALMFASLRGAAPLIELLLDADADVNARNKARGSCACFLTERCALTRR